MAIRNLAIRNVVSRSPGSKKKQKNLKIRNPDTETRGGGNGRSLEDKISHC